jgi:hypothetical protein
MSTGHGEKSSRKQEAAIAALLSCSTIGAAAEAVGISEGTLRCWMKRPKFAAKYRRARTQIVDHSIGVLQVGAHKAVEALTRNLECGVASAEIAAARAALEFALRGIELADFEERLLALEAAQTSGARS